MNEITESIQPYLNPDYWGGHSIGYGPAEAPPPYIPLVGHGQREAKRMLRERLLRMAKAIPLETYQEGEIFDASGYEPGTLLLFREEHIAGSNASFAFDPEEFENQKVPAKPMGTEPNFHMAPSEDFKSIRDEEKDIRYLTRSSWGIVPEDNAPPVIFTASTASTMKIGAGILLGILNWRHLPIEVGQTKHYEKDGRETIDRINVIDVVAYGETQKKRSGIRQAVGKLAFRASHT